MLLNFALIIFLILIINQVEALEVQDILSKFNQHDYEVKFEHMDVVEYDKKYMKMCSIKTFKYNRTTTVVNFTVMNRIDYKEDIALLIQGYKFLSNEYRVFPIHFQVNFCKAIKENMAGLREILMQSGNFNECPTKKNVLYKIVNCVMDPSKLPPYIPNGQYMFETHMLYLNQEISVIQAYGSVSRKILPRD